MMSLMLARGDDFYVREFLLPGQIYRPVPAGCVPTSVRQVHRRRLNVYGQIGHRRSGLFHAWLIWPSSHSTSSVISDRTVSIVSLLLSPSTSTSFALSEITRTPRATSAVSVRSFSGSRSPGRWVSMKTANCFATLLCRDSNPREGRAPFISGRKAIDVCQPVDGRDDQSSIGSTWL